jgi:hypothetical protein
MFNLYEIYIKTYYHNKRIIFITKKKKKKKKNCCEKVYKKSGNRINKNILSIIYNMDRAEAS